MLILLHPGPQVERAFVSIAIQIIEANKALFDALRATLATQNHLTSEEVWDVASSRYLPLKRPWGDDWQVTLTRAYRGVSHEF